MITRSYFLTISYSCLAAFRCLLRWDHLHQKYGLLVIFMPSVAGTHLPSHDELTTDI